MRLRATSTWRRQCSGCRPTTCSTASATTRTRARRCRRATGPR
uniref:SI397 n=1 Tax=Arundo donax TaxID=35708 RepID=A0A0A9FWQ3_ARUDO